MQRMPTRVPLFAIILLALSPATVHAAGPDEGAEGLRPAQPAVPAETLICDDGDPACRENRCYGEAEIIGVDSRTCIPCLDNSVAGLSNRQCVCVAGYVEGPIDQWGRPDCRLPTPPQAPPLETVEIPGREMHNIMVSLGFSPEISPPPGFVCEAGGREPGQTYMQFLLFPGPGLDVSILFAPPPENPEDYTCRVRIFGATLQNGWTFSGLVGATPAVHCGSRHIIDPSYNTLTTVTKRNGDPTDTTHDVVLRGWGTKFCRLTIDGVLLTGPAGEHWKTAFGF